MLTIIGVGAARRRVMIADQTGFMPARVIGVRPGPIASMALRMVSVSADVDRGRDQARTDAMSGAEGQRQQSKKSNSQRP